MNDILVAAAGRPWERDVLHAVAGLDATSAGRRCVDVPDLLAIASLGGSRAAIVSLRLQGLDADTVHRLTRHGVLVIAVREADDAAERALSLGITRELPADALDGLADELRTGEPVPAIERREGPDAARMTVVWGPSGAPGRSTVALNLAAELAHDGTATVLVDADPYGGSIAQMLSVLDEVSGLLAATRAANSGDTTVIHDHLLAVAPKLSLLTGLPRADLWPHLRPGALARVVDALSAQCEHVVADVGFSLEAPDGFEAGAPHRNQTTLQLLDAADRVVVVGAADPVGLARLARGLLTLRDVAPAAPLTVVVNKRRASLGWSGKEISETIGRLTGHVPDVVLPLDVGAVDKALLRGRTVRETAPDSALRKGLTELAAVIR